MNAPTVAVRGSTRRSRPSRFEIAAFTAVLAIATTALTAPVAQAAQAGDYLFERQIGSEGSANGEFAFASDVALDAAGDVYVADAANQRVQKLTSDGDYVMQWSTTQTSTRQFFPFGIAVDPAGFVYVTEQSSNSVVKFTTAGAFVRQWGSAGTGEGQFTAARGIDVAPDGTVYVTDIGNHTIQRFSADGEFLSRWGGAGEAPGQLSSPYDVAVDGVGSVYVADSGNHRVQRFSAAGALQTKWGSRGEGAGQFVTPQGIAVDGSGNVFVADSRNDRVQKFSGTGAYLTQFGAPGDGPGQSSGLVGLTVGGSGRVYATDYSNHRVQVFRPAAQPVFTGGLTGRAVVGRGYASQVRVTAFPAVQSFALASGALPPGLALDASGRVGGKPTKPGVYTFGVRANNGVLPAAVKSFTITVGSPAVFTAGLKSRAVVGKKYSSQLRASGFPAVKSFSIVSGKLPKGLKLSASGRVTGKPKQAGKYTVKIRANSTVSPATVKKFTITVKKR